MKAPFTQVIKVKKIKYTIPEFFLPALINNDLTGLTKEEENALEAFIKYALHGSDNDNKLISYHWSDDNSSEKFFTAYHEVTPILACDCVEVELVFISRK